MKVENNLFPGGPKFSPDGRYVYYEVLAGPVNGTYNDTDTLQGDAQVRRLDLTTGRTDPITAGHVFQQDQGSSGGAYAVEPSPDGRFLAFARRMPDGLLSYKSKLFGPRTALWVRDLESGSERLVMDPVEYDFAEGLAPIDQTLPGYRWTADGRAIVISQGGKIRRLDLASAQVSTIAFNARVQRSTSERVKPSVRLSDGPFETKFARWHTVSPDGRTLAFQAVGRIWLMNLPSGTPRRLTPESSQPYEYYPAWSPDGRSIAFVTWDEKDSGQLWVAGINGGAPKPIARQPAEYLAPAWTPDGQSLIAARGAGATARGQGLTRNQYWDLVNVSLTGGEARPVARVAGLIPQVSFANGRLFYYEPASEGLTLISVTLDGLDRREHLKASHAGEIAVSPDAKWVAFTLGANAFIAPMSATGYAGALPVIGKSGGALPVTQLSTVGGLFPRWRNAQTLTFGNGNHFVSYDVASKRTDATTIKLSVPRDLPRGSIALTNARILTMENRQIIAKGTIVIRAGRIACVGDCNTAGVDHTVDLAGRTVMPGMIDMHAHHHREYVAIQPPHDFETAIYLAYGVTTTFDPTTSSFGVFPTAELIEAGGMIGPRVFTTAEFMVPRETAWTNESNSAAAMLDDAKRRVQWGAMGLKDYMQGDSQSAPMGGRSRPTTRCDGDGRRQPRPRSQDQPRAGWAHGIRTLHRARAAVFRFHYPARPTRLGVLGNAVGRRHGCMERTILLAAERSVEGRQAAALDAVATTDSTHASTDAPTADRLFHPAARPSGRRHRRSGWHRTDRLAWTTTWHRLALGHLDLCRGHGPDGRARSRDTARREVLGNGARSRLDCRRQARRHRRARCRSARKHS